MLIPAWLTPMLIEFGTSLVLSGLEKLKDKADETDNKVDDKLITLTEKILDHKVNQTDTVLDSTLKQVVSEAIKRGSAK